MSTKNILHIGDNLEVMKTMDDESFDLIYLDPPFNSDRNYNMLKGKDEEEDPEQARCFEDRWRYAEHQEATDRVFKELVLRNDRLSKYLEFIKSSDKQSQINDNMNHFAYLTFMAVRLSEMRRLLKPTGSIYLHVDTTESHYLKQIMDIIFGMDNFRNEVIWGYDTAGRSKKRFNKKHDTILFYSKTNKYFFNLPKTEFIDIASFCHVDSDGRKYRERTNSNNGKTYRYYQDEGRGMNDWWSDIPALPQNAKERSGYSTQKPESLLVRIITASCPSDGIILDPFCGCGTSITVAAKKGIRYEGIDISEKSEHMMKIRMERAGLPMPKVQRSDGFTIQKRVNKALGFHNHKDTGADGGVDGYRKYKLPGNEPFGAISSVKSGKTSLSQFRDFCHVIDREKADCGVLVMRDTPSKQMRIEQSNMGYYKGTDVHRLQIFTVDEVLDPKFHSIALPTGAIPI